MSLAVHLLRAGQGLPLVLLHAFPVDSRMWADLAAAWPGAGPLLAIDLPGLGESPVPDGPAGLDVAADAVAAQLRTAGHGRVVVAGLSMGGYVTMALAERHPDLVAGIGLLDTKSTADTAGAARNRRQIADQVLTDAAVDAVLPMASALLAPAHRTGRPDLVDRMTGWIAGQQPAGVAWSQRAMADRPDRTDVLAAWSRPSLVLVGAQDEATPPLQAQVMAQALGVTAVLVPDAGHMTAVEAPEAVAVALTDLVEACA